AIDGQNGAGDVGSLVAGEEHGGLGDFSRLTDAAEGRFGKLSVVELGTLWRRDSRGNRAGAGRIDANVVLIVVTGCTPGEPNQSVLHARVSRRASRSDNSLDRRDVDNRSCPALNHQGQDFTQKAGRTHQGGLKALVPFVARRGHNVVPWREIGSVIA